MVGEGGGLGQCASQDAAHLGEVGGDRVALALELLELTGGHLSGDIGVGAGVADDLLGLDPGLGQGLLGLGDRLLLTLAGLGVGAGADLLGAGERLLQAFLGLLGLDLGLFLHLPDAFAGCLVGVGVLLGGLLVRRGDLQSRLLAQLGGLGAGGGGLVGG